MSLLNHRIDYSKPRKVIGDIIIYHPTKEIKDDIKIIIQNQVKPIINENKISIEANISDISIIRQMFISLTNQKEEIEKMTDYDLNLLIKDGDFTIQQVKEEFESIIREILLEIKSEVTTQLLGFIDELDTMELANKLQAISGKMGIDIKDLFKMVEVQASINKLESNNKKNKVIR